MTASSKDTPKDTAKPDRSSEPAWPNEGEGNKSADKTYREGVRATVKSGHVKEQAKQAADALDGPEGEELKRAEEEGRKKAR